RKTSFKGGSLNGSPNDSAKREEMTECEAPVSKTHLEDCIFPSTSVNSAKSQGRSGEEISKRYLLVALLSDGQL
ncbi:hypothetical protein ADUPG1_003892, partial [Aduncisulcus paluster]